MHFQYTLALLMVQVTDRCLKELLKLRQVSQFTPSRKEYLNRIPGEHCTLDEVVVRFYNNI